ncbi:MAG: GNAT family N-acetyltransferase [Armatimonadota bacterium]|nr:GNAT family N-acetyltransferase [Armatimonadota bacterium]
MANVMAAATVTDSLAEAAFPLGAGAGDGAVRVTEIRGEREIERLRPAWNETLEHIPGATVFQTWEWQYTWLRHFGRRGTALVLLLSDASAGGKPFGIAPFVIRPYVVPQLRELAFLGTGVSDYLDVIVHPDKRSDAMAAVGEYLESCGGEWDFVDLHQIPEAGAAVELAEIVGRPPGMSAEVVEHEVCPVVDLPDSWEDYTRSLGKSLRFNIGYYERSLRKQYKVEIGAADESNLNEEMEALFRLHGRRWRKRWLPGVLASRKVREFHREVARRFLDCGRLRLYYLKLDGVTRASLYCFAFKDAMYYYLGGFEPEMAKYGLGTILTAHAIREAIQSGLSRFDLLRGNEEYKRRWKPRLTVNSRLFVRKSGARSHTAAALHRLEGRAERAFKERVMGIRGS